MRLSLLDYERDEPSSLAQHPSINIRLSSNAEPLELLRHENIDVVVADGTVRKCSGITTRSSGTMRLPLSAHLTLPWLSGDRMWELLTTLATRRAERAASVDARLAALEREAVNAEEKFKRLYKLIEDGVAEMDDLLKDRISALKNDRDRTREALARARGNVQAKAEVTEETVAKFSELMRQKLQEGETPAREAWLTTIVDRIEVDDGIIRLFGRKDALEQCIIADATGLQGVRTFVPRWRTIQDKGANTYVVEIAI